MALSNGSLLLCALNKGENWMKLVFSMKIIKEKWFKSNTQLFGQISDFHTLLGLELAFLGIRVRIHMRSQKSLSKLESGLSMLRFDL